MFKENECLINSVRGKWEGQHSLLHGLTLAPAPWDPPPGHKSAFGQSVPTYPSSASIRSTRAIICIRSDTFVASHDCTASVVVSGTAMPQMPCRCHRHVEVVPRTRTLPTDFNLHVPKNGPRDRIPIPRLRFDPAAPPTPPRPHRNNDSPAAPTLCGSGATSPWTST